jgi:hypothetical protein
MDPRYELPTILWPSLHDPIEAVCARACFRTRNHRASITSSVQVGLPESCHVNGKRATLSCVAD